MTEQAFELHRVLGYQKHKSMGFDEFIEECTAQPENVLRVSSQLISEAISFFGFNIIVRSGDPTITYSIFDDPFSGGVNAIFGQEHCIKQLVDVIDQVGRESGPNRGIVLAGPPASGKTNIVDLISLAVEEYTKQKDVRIYSFYFRLTNNAGQELEIRSPFLRNPILLFPPTLQMDSRIARPREEFFNHLKKHHGAHLSIPPFYRDATIDRCSAEILQALLENPRNQGKALSDIIEEYVRVEEVVFSNGLARGIANSDDLSDLRVRHQQSKLGDAFSTLLSEHLPGLSLCTYNGALVAANGGLLHIHDAFAAGTDEGPSQEAYKPLLMLLGSGKASVEATQASIDTTVVITTNVEEMASLERQLTSQKLMDRIEKIPVNYLLDCTSEMDILRRDLANINERYDIDPNLLLVASYYAVLSRLMPPFGKKLPESWSTEKCRLYKSITPEQKLFIYASESVDPLKTIQRLPFFHPFRNVAFKLGINIEDPESYADRIVRREDRPSLEVSDLFSPEELVHIDDEFMRQLRCENYPQEGQCGISVRQSQNIMRNTLASSDGRKVHVGTFISQLKRLFREGASVHHWLAGQDASSRRKYPIAKRSLGEIQLQEGHGDFGDFEGLVSVVQALYFRIISSEITMATVDRDPAEIEVDLRRYLQHALLHRAVQNQAFAHVLVPRFSYVDERSGAVVDKANVDFLQSMETVLFGKQDGSEAHRDKVAMRFLRLQDSGELEIESGKSVIASRNDKLLDNFRSEYQQLLSHRKTVEGLDPDALTLAFVHKRNDLERYQHSSEGVRELVEQILNNLTAMFGYSRQLGLDTVVYAIRKRIIDFGKILR